jgi:hypothetical protein
MFIILCFRNRLLVGLFKLSEANSLVGTMQDELVQIGPQLVQKQKVYHFIMLRYWLQKNNKNNEKKLVEFFSSTIRICQCA